MFTPASVSSSAFCLATIGTKIKKPIAPRMKMMRSFLSMGVAEVAKCGGGG